MRGSKYGKSNKTIHASNVRCTGNEYSFAGCQKSTYSLSNGKQQLQTAEVAGVDCIYDEPTPPPCIVNPKVAANDSCNAKGSVRLVNNAVQSTTSEGRVEYCNGEYWTPLCTMDNRAAAVICKELGHTQYQCKEINKIEMETNKIRLYF